MGINGHSYSYSCDLLGQMKYVTWFESDSASYPQTANSKLFAMRLNMLFFTPRINATSIGQQRAQ